MTKTRIIINRRRPSTTGPTTDSIEHFVTSGERRLLGDWRVHGKVTGRPSRFPVLLVLYFIAPRLSRGRGGSMAHDTGDPDRVPSMPNEALSRGRVKNVCENRGERKIFIDEYDA